MKGDYIAHCLAISQNFKRLINKNTYLYTFVPNDKSILVSVFIYARI